MSYHPLPTGATHIQLLARIHADVVAATKGKQVAWGNSSLPGEVYLAEK